MRIWRRILIHVRPLGPDELAGCVPDWLVIYPSGKGKASEAAERASDALFPAMLTQGEQLKLGEHEALTEDEWPRSFTVTKADPDPLPVPLTSQINSQARESHSSLKVSLSGRWTLTPLLPSQAELVKTQNL